MSKPMPAPASGAGGIPTPVASSPPASESFFSEFDGTATGSVMDTSFGDMWEPPADATALNIVSWKLGVDAQVEDGIEKRGFNAISTVLNHPTKKANPLRASRKPLPPPAQPPPILPKPRPASYYDEYLKSIAPLYEKFLQSQQPAALSSLAPTSDLDLQQRAKLVDLPSLDSIPETFFDPNFDIANPATWSEVMEAAETSPKPRDAAVQESLSTHLDNLETHLVHEITLRSSSFFSALSNLQDLNSESTSCLRRIDELKTALSDVGGKQARKGLEIIDAQSRLRSLRVTERGIKRLAELDDFLRIAKGMADGGDWAGALGCVEDVVRWWERNSPGETTEPDSEHLPLTTLSALNNLPTLISILTSNIASQIESVLASALLSAIVESENGRDFDKDGFRVAVQPMLIGLVRCGKLDTLSGVWRSVVTTAVREGLRQHLPSNDEEDGEGKESRGSSLAQSLQALDHAQFLILCKAMYGSMLVRLHRTQNMGEAMSTILSENSDVAVLSISTSPRPPTKTEFEPSDVLTAACELANSRASKIISVRGEQHASLPLQEFIDMFKESWSFVVATEALNKRMIVALRGTLASHARGFLISYHAKRLTRSAKLVEEETWVQVDTPPSTQHAVGLIVEAAVSDPGECFVPPKQNGTSNGEPLAPSKLLSIEGKTFFVVKATAESLTLLSEYLPIVINLEVVVTDVISRIIEFLKSFNSRTCQVVLGAGAMRSAGLKNITAKHLALASQSLSVVVALIPYIREFLRRHLSAKQTVMLIEFDKLKRDYQEHQNEIHAKLVAIMADRLAVHCGELREVDWEATPAKEGPHAYALMLVKETATLHKVLSKYLAPSTVEGVMSQVLAASVHRLSEEFTKVELKSDAAKNRMLQDVAVIVTRLTPLSESGSTVSSLETLVRNKATPRKPVAATMRGLLRRNGNAESSPTSTPIEVPPEEENDDEEGDGLTQEGPERVTSPSRSPVRPSSPLKTPVGSRPGTPVRVASPIRAPPSPSRPLSPSPVRSGAATPIRSPSPVPLGSARSPLLSPERAASPAKGPVCPERPSSPAKTPSSPQPLDLPEQSPNSAIAPAAPASASPSPPPPVSKDESEIPKEAENKSETPKEAEDESDTQKEAPSPPPK